MNQFAISDPKPRVSTQNLVAVLGPTNTGKTHLAIERMLAHASGVIGLPLRLLAREVYNRIAERIGADRVALITGEEKITPSAPRFRVCTVEAMPNETDAAFLAVDEIQLAGDLERGHVFTDRLLNLRGREETLLLGAATMRSIVEKLLPGINIVTRPRMSQLTYSGSKKITRLPRRSAVVAFSADEVYAIAELIRRQRGGAAVVLGSLSPRTRNAQVELFQSGQVDFLVATDAIGMGLNLDVDHVAFASDRKFDGYQFRRLSAAELAQIAGRAGRHIRDGTFGVTSRVGDFEDPLVEAIESHRFDAVKTLQWRNRNLDFTSLKALKDSLEQAPEGDGLTKAPISEDVAVLDISIRNDPLAALADSPARIALLWDVCQIPDYRKIALANHAELVATIFEFLARGDTIPDDWFARQVAFADHTDGDIDTLANRIAHIRTWTFAANRPQWLADPYHWQERTREIEDRLSDALHERLTARFVDRRTSVLMRRLKENAMLEAEITASGDVLVEGQHVGSLQGFRFLPDPNADGPDGKALRAAAQKALASEFSARSEKVANAPNEDLILATDGTLRWQGAAIARLVEGDDALKPRYIVLADETLTAADRERLQVRVDLWLVNRAETLLKPLFDLAASDKLTAPSRGIAFRLVENYGAIERAAIADEVRALDQEARAGLRALGVRFGAYHIYVPALLKPAPSALLATLWAVKNGGPDQPGLADLAGLAASGRTSLAVDTTIPGALYRIVGYSIAGSRAVRIDILERLADLIRPLIAWRPSSEDAVPPDGAVPGNGFAVTVAMTSLLGCSGDDFSSVLRALGYRMERRPAPTVQGKEAAMVDAGSSDPTAESEIVSVDSDDTSTSSADSPLPLVGTTDATAIEGEASDRPMAFEEITPTNATPPAATGTVGRDGTAAPTELAAVTEPTAPEGLAADAAGGFAEAPALAGSLTSEAAAGAPGTIAVSGDAEAGDPAFIEIWRPERRDRSRSRRDRPTTTERLTSRRPAQGDSPTRGEPGNKHRQRSRKPGKRVIDGERRPPPRGKPQAEKRADPDSPFAALAALKAQLEGTDEGN